LDVEGKREDGVRDDCQMFEVHFREEGSTTTKIRAVRYCQIKTTPHVERKDLLEPDRRAVTPGFRVKRLG
jgi:hypothetical protein